MKHPFKKFFHAPIQFMSRVYKKRYHLKYVHARKLFFFDIILLLGTVLLIVSTIFWYTYDPTITGYVKLNISAVDDTGEPLSRIASGEPITYTITYENTSDVLMSRPQLQIEPPAYFQITTITAPNIAYTEDTQTFSLPDLVPKATGSIEIEGVYYGTPDAYENVSVHLSYVQEGKTTIENRRSTIISTLRDTVLTGTLTAPNIIRGRGSYPVSLTLTNTGTIAIGEVELPTETSIGTITWNESPIIAPFEAKTSQTRTGVIAVSFPASQNSATLSIVPTISLDGAAVPQKSIESAFTIVHPASTLRSANWSATTAAPGATVDILLTAQNTGDSILTDGAIRIPLNSNIISTANITRLNAGSTLSQGNLLIPIGTSLAPNETVQKKVSISILSVPRGGTDITLRLSPTFVATAPGSQAPLSSAVETNPLAIGTAFLVQGESRYYTDEGDQLGRGSLPPTVGKETKYWALFTLQNTSSRVDNVTFSATLPATTQWTGRTSVSLGNDITYNKQTNTLSWTRQSLSPYQTVGLNIELTVTPTESMRGSVPVLVQNIRATANDTYISEPIVSTMRTISADLAKDQIGKQKGTIVQ